MKLTKQRIMELVSQDLNTTNYEADELERLALIGWDVERAKEVSHINHCDNGPMCTWKEAHKNYE